MSERFFSKTKDFLRCPKCLAELNLDNARTFLICQDDASHRFPVIDNIPSFVKREEISPEDAKWVFEYDEKAEKYDEAVKKYDEWLGVDLKKERLRMLERVSQIFSTDSRRLNWNWRCNFGIEEGLSRHCMRIRGHRPLLWNAACGSTKIRQCWC